MMLTGKPYDFRNYNCWHHVRLARGFVGKNTPVFDVTSPSDIPDAFDRGHADTKGLTRQEKPEDYDVVLMGYEHGARVIWHAGVYYQGYVSHCARQEKQVKLESMGDLARTYSRLEFWR